MSGLPSAPATERNREPILAVLQDLLPPTATVLEVASGTGEHAVFFAAAMPDVQWQPTDADPSALATIAARRQGAGTTNLLPPLPLDAAAPGTWPDVPPPDAVVAINMIHIAPWAATEGLFAGAAAVLPPGGTVLLYGPFREDGAFAGGNAAFDASLRARNPEWGVRDVDAVTQAAARHGFTPEARVEMPANNLVLAFRLG